MFNFQFDAATIDLILEGLAELPYKRSARAIHDLTAGVRAQVAATEKAAADAAKPTRRRKQKEA